MLQWLISTICSNKIGSSYNRIRMFLAKMAYQRESRFCDHDEQKEKFASSTHWLKQRVGKYL